MRAPRVPRLFPAARRRTLALTLGVVFLTAAGGFLATAYAAWADDVSSAGAGAAADAADSSSTDETIDTTTEAVATEPVPGTTEESPPPAETTASDGETTQPTAEEPPPPVTVTDPAPPASSPPPPGPRPHTQAILKTKHKNRPAEIGEGGHATIWLHRVLPDPTPPAKRLAPAFARRLRAISSAAHVRWWLVLAVVRARGGDGRFPARAASLQRLADRLDRLHSRRHPWRAVGVLSRGNEKFADRTVALARYNRAVTLRALVHGLDWAKPVLARKVLRDRWIAVYPGGRMDISMGRIDVRVLVLIRYLRMTYRQVTVSSLFSGHRFFARPGVVSAHMYGLAVDIAALARTPINGHQQPGGITEKAIKAILLLPAEVQPQQVISLLGLGGPSFPLADHYDHIHVGY
jgi:hypothetical protein